MKKILLLGLSISTAFVSFGQTMVNDFEAGSAALLNLGGGMTADVVTNPNMTGLNTTSSCLEIRRTAAQWWVFAGVDVNDLMISDTEIKYLSMMVNFPSQSDLGIRFDATADDNNGNEVVRPLNEYDATSSGEWQEIVFEIKDNETATAFTLGTLYRLSIHPDMGFENDPVGQILNDTDMFGYIDEIRILDTNPLHVNSFDIANNISIYPNPADSAFKIKAMDNTSITDISVFNFLGKRVMHRKPTANQEHYDISDLASGMYLVKITDDNGNSITKRLMKQ
ncbi:T9SS type A sorting domain-containing protein [Winogradskyella thalassocola]|uniref:Por secretion system C-terminal sorting domain-containing protein n=1 Tax=Winogradskyella thalassocola TaxID=262004 RepID=A0A1G7WF16_9FLAO|nr:T9SS type A sorting domain-containing protein [Winogradskyella thalassocola]SDG70454.1 Por secretion system C-terminal sorting domain-containing protein [Winogradskyella thalassocola]